jgi:hypothetical protein
MKYLCYLLATRRQPPNTFYYQSSFTRFLYRFTNMRLYVVVECALLGVNVGLAMSPQLSQEERPSLVMVHKFIMWFFICWTMLRILSNGIFNLLRDKLCLFEMLTSALFLVVAGS